jgi:hypothetical protein
VGGGGGGGGSLCLCVNGLPCEPPGRALWTTGVNLHAV